MHCAHIHRSIDLSESKQKVQPNITKQMRGIFNKTTWTLAKTCQDLSMLKSDMHTWVWEQVGCSWPDNLTRVDTCVTCTHIYKLIDMSELKPNVQPNIPQIKVSASPWGLIRALIDQTFSNVFCQTNTCHRLRHLLTSIVHTQ